MGKWKGSTNDKNKARPYGKNARDPRDLGAGTFPSPPRVVGLYWDLLRILRRGNAKGGVLFSS